MSSNFPALPAFSRPVHHRYLDPLDLVWLRTVERLGFRVVRTPEAYATSDGRGTLGVGTADTLDADDCLAQILFHELCHALTQGPALLGAPDWGLDNEGDRDAVREHACLRLQAALLDRHGLRRFLAPTTDYRAFYDALGEAALEGAAGDGSVALARAAWDRYHDGPWRMTVEAALRATAEIAAQAAPFAGDDDLVALGPARRAEAHPPGVGPGPRARRCGGCAWAAPGRTAKAAASLRCRLWGRRVAEDTASCEAFEEPLDCQRCGACCREAYGAVEIHHKEAVRDLHPHLITVSHGQLCIVRDGDRCAALRQDDAGRFGCSIYADRPRTCHEFERGGKNCLDARQRVGLTFLPDRPTRAPR